MARSTCAALPLIALLLGGCATREASSPAAPRSEPAKEPLAPQQTPSNAGAAPPTSLDEDEGSKLTTIEAAEAELVRVERQLDGLWAEAEKPESKAQDPLAGCDTSCKAFLSLERAAAAICRIAGDADARCVRARKSVEKNRQRISECACS